MNQSREAWPKLPATVRLVLMLVFVSTVMAVSIRILGEWSGIAMLRDTLPTKAINGLVAIALLGLSVLYGFRNGFWAATYLIGALIICSILAAHLVFSPPAAPDAWNTIPFELIRFFSISLYIYAIFYVPRTWNTLHPQMLRAFVYIMGLLVAVAILQSILVLPNFYFQWYGAEHLPRPTGGLEHPHFFALLLVFGMAAIYIARDDGIMGREEHAIWMGIFLLGIFVSTSRVGFVAAFIFLFVLLATRVKLTRLTVWGGVGLYLAIFGVIVLMVYADTFRESAVATRVEVFLSAFIESFMSGDNEDSSFLRGRGERWAIELEYIMADTTSFLFGYGHQPFVSHNLALRQLQVSGLVGLLAYLAMLVSLCVYWLSAARREHRRTILALLAALMLASVTFPILVSVPVACAMVLIALASIPKIPVESRERVDGLPAS